MTFRRVSFSMSSTFFNLKLADNFSKVFCTKVIFNVNQIFFQITLTWVAWFASSSGCSTSSCSTRARACTAASSSRRTDSRTGFYSPTSSSPTCWQSRRSVRLSFVRLPSGESSWRVSCSSQHTRPKEQKVLKTNGPVASEFNKSAIASIIIENFYVVWQPGVAIIILTPLKLSWATVNF